MRISFSSNERGCVETQSDMVQPAGANEDDGSAIGGGKLKKRMLLHLNSKPTILWYVMLYKQSVEMRKYLRLQGSFTG